MISTAPYERGAVLLLTAEDRIRNLTATVGDADTVARMRELIASHEWQFAKSMPYIPHEYSLKRAWSRDQFNEFLAFIWDHGVDAWFGTTVTPKRYWFDHEGGYYYFVDPLDLDGKKKATDICQLINRAKITNYEFWEDRDLLESRIRCKVKRLQ